MLNFTVLDLSSGFKNLPGLAKQIYLLMAENLLYGLK